MRVFFFTKNPNLKNKKNLWVEWGGGGGGGAGAGVARLSDFFGGGTKVSEFFN